MPFLYPRWFLGVSQSTYESLCCPVNLPRLGTACVLKNGPPPLPTESMLGGRTPCHRSTLGSWIGQGESTGNVMPTEISFSQRPMESWWWPQCPHPSYRIALRVILNCLIEFLGKIRFHLLTIVSYLIIDNFLAVFLSLPRSLLNQWCFLGASLK